MGVLCFAYRFNKLGEGGLGGFTNDQFGYLTRARQLLAGELPFRDFNDPGWFLTDVASAAAQYIGGYNLLSEAILTTAMLAIGAATTFALGYRASGSLLAALVAALLHIAIDPRHYNYPKITFYALGILAAWRYVDRPTVVRLTLLALCVGVAALFRHDHAIYLGGFALLTVMLVNRHDRQVLARNVAVLATISLLIVAPFLVFLQVNGGIREYYRSTMVYANRDFARANFSFPRFALATEAVKPPVVRINVRWAEATNEAQRHERETRYSLVDPLERGSYTWNYQLLNTDQNNIAALVRDPLIADTHGVNRTTFAVQQPSASSPVAGWLPSVRTTGNATAWLYYVFLLLPAVVALALAMLYRRVRHHAVVASPVLIGPAYLVPLIVLAVAINYSFMSRGNTSSRIPDVAVTSAICTAWLLAAIHGQTARSLFASPWLRASIRTAAVLVLVVSVAAVDALADIVRSVDVSRMSAGPLAVAERTATVWRTLRASPPLESFPERMPGVVRMARYINACTRPDDRLFLFGELPELYYLSGRLIAGGHSWLLPGYYSDDLDERLTLERLGRARVPIVVTPVSALYDAEYRPQFDLIDAYLTEHYRDAGNIDLGDEPKLRVLVRRDLVSNGVYGPLGLPCFGTDLGNATLSGAAR